MYLILTSSNIFLLLNCSIQRFLNNNFYIKHVMLFVSIYLLTFILNWYKPSSIMVSEGFSVDDKYSYFFQSLKYSFYIFVIFILTSKMEIYSFLVFIIFFVFSFCIFLLYKANLNTIGLDTINNDSLIITYEDVLKNINQEGDLRTKDTINNILYYHNSLLYIYGIMPFIIVYGVYKYYQKELKEKGNQFDNVKFFLGSNTCRK
jgi:hypothetical protein